MNAIHFENVSGMRQGCCGPGMQTDNEHRARNAAIDGAVSIKQPVTWATGLAQTNSWCAECTELSANCSMAHHTQVCVDGTLQLLMDAMAQHCVNNCLSSVESLEMCRDNRHNPNNTNRHIHYLITVYNVLRYCILLDYWMSTGVWLVQSQQSGFEQLTTVLLISFSSQLCHRGWPNP